MGMVFIVLGILILTFFPFFILKQTNKMKLQSTPRGKYKLFLICAMPIPILGFVILFIGLWLWM